MSDTVLVEVSGAVAVVTLNRPDGMNALTVEAKEALLAAITSVGADDAVRAVVLTGSGRAFCVGQDLREHAALISSGDPAPLSTVKEHYNPIVSQLMTMPKPVIAAINGTAAGAGLGLACACDFRVGAAGSRYTTAFAGIGLTADSGLSWTLPRLVGSGRAGALLMLAEPFTAEQALEMGILNLCVAPEQVLVVASELAARLAAGPTAAYAAIKESLLYGADASLLETLAKEDELQTRAGATEDHGAAVSSFLAKTPPVFTGR
ncbi:MAG: 2-(1,2-epoxy,2-dihydrophenyl)acetyl-CoA isomerase [Nocardioidaceae bacterium]|nr:2-(1,2-epoxy,2-dihydrophenyl)acetyl-CoA isomerase [Nocardioidaceae bacterium]